ncbi:MAG: hypothetical protein OEL77_02480 [Nitrosopumilus sp.]|nr:hypothetical protein [Nitrosopumilus sp.]MDH3384860.1 hypothetical protein [Nitrosopumilus sp.]
MINQKIWPIVILSAIVIFSSSSLVFAHPHSGQVFINEHTHQAQTEYISINGIIGIEKTSLMFHTPEENSLPWAFVEGKIANHVSGYPVIIQIFKNDEPAHFAQTEVTEDGSYEYKFRVLNTENGKTTKIFNGDYYVTIFKVVYLNLDNLI